MIPNDECHGIRASMFGMGKKSVRRKSLSTSNVEGKVS